MNGDLSCSQRLNFLVVHVVDFVRLQPLPAGVGDHGDLPLLPGFGVILGGILGVAMSVGRVATHKVEMHYKYLAQSPRYFCDSHTHTVASFKALAREASTNPEVWEQHAGIAMGNGVPGVAPTLAKPMDFVSTPQQTNSQQRSP